MQASIFTWDRYRVSHDELSVEVSRKVKRLKPFVYREYKFPVIIGVVNNFLILNGTTYIMLF